MNTITLKLDLYEYKQVESTCKIVAEKLGLQKDKVEQPQKLKPHAPIPPWPKTKVFEIEG